MTLKAVVILIALFVLFVSFRSQIKKDAKTKNDQEVVATISPSFSPLPQGWASWYGHEVCQEHTLCKTASGEVFDEDKLTFAHRTLPFGTWVEFCHDNKCVVARANDRGPFVVGRDFDLSLGTFRLLANPTMGVIKINWRIIK